MSTLYVTEYPGLGSEPSGPQAQAAVCPPLAEQTVAIGATHAESSAFGSKTYLVRCHADVICSVLVGGKAPVATTGSGRFIAGQTEYFAVTPGDKLSVIANT